MKHVKSFDSVNEEFDPTSVGSIVFFAGIAAFAFSYFIDKRKAVNDFYKTVAEKEGKTIDEVKMELKTNPAKKEELKKVLKKVKQEISDAFSNSTGINR